MAEDDSPPSWVPVDQHVGQVPIRITRDVDSASISPKPETDVNALAKQIIRDNQPIINRFVAVQRQQVEVGEKDVHNNVLPLKDLTVYYQNVQGLERMHYHVSPKVEEPAEVKIPEQAEAKPPTPPPPEEPLELEQEKRTPEARAPEPVEPPEVKEPEPPKEEKLPEFEEPKLPEEEKPPEVETPEEEEAKVPKEEEPPEEEERKASPEFIQVDIACFLPVTFGDQAGDAPRGKKE